MNLDELHRKKVAEWIAQGLKLSEIQSRLASDLGLSMTYMDVRFLVDDLKLTPKDAEPVKPAQSVLTAAGTPPPADNRTLPTAPNPAGPGPTPTAATGSVSLSVDQIARPGAIVSGKVTFSDGNRAEWYLDQTGRLAMAPEKQGYRPPAGDVQQFQAALETELSRMGF